MNRHEFKDLLYEWNGLLCEEEGLVSVERILKMVDSIEELSNECSEKIKILYSLEGVYGRVEYSAVGDEISGAIDFERESSGRELGDFFVFETFPVTEGYGPLLYEILVEKATEVGVCLMSDRSEVSDSARRVWDKYFKRVGFDIEYKQIAGDVSSSLSKCYSKRGDLVILNRLRNSKFIEFIEE